MRHRLLTSYRWGPGATAAKSPKMLSKATPNGKKRSFRNAVG